MTTTRSAAKKQAQPSGAPSAEEADPGSKHKRDGGARPPSPKRPKKEDEKKDETARGKAHETTKE